MSFQDAPAAPAATAFPIEVYLNVTEDADGRMAGFDGYQPGHTLVHAASLTVQAADLHSALDHAYMLLNVGDDPTFGEPDEQAVAYRARRNRSLSTGDVLMIDGAALALGSSGFQPARVDPAQISRENAFGATSID